MKQTLSRLLQVPRLTGTRMVLAMIVAVIADGMQFFLGLLLGPLEWTFVDPAIDAGAAVLTVWLLGFHILLLPTFAMKLIPLAEELPTWTACVAAVIVLRKREQRAPKPEPPASIPPN